MSGKEKLIKQFLESINEDQAEATDCRLIYYETKRRYLGQWHSEKRLLFPGYIFAVTDRVDQLYNQLKKVPEFTRILGTGDDIVPLSKSEESLLRRLSEDSETVGMSYGVQEGDRIIIKEGNLKGFESKIRKIDRHKRKAWIDIDLLGTERLVEVGLEIVEKR